MLDFERWLARRREQGLYRQRRQLESPQGVEIDLDGQQLLAFCSNDYLGLASHPELVELAGREVERLGVGGGASHLICGHHEEHHQLELALARFCKRDAALLFSTGYMANLGVISALAGRGDSLFQDRLNHASLIDGGLLSRAKLWRYPHADTQALEQRLRSASGQRVVVTDGVFSMDGDLAPLPALAQVCRDQDACLVVDDAHGFGVLGESGGGILEHFGLDQAQVPVVVGTLGKAFGTAGAFVAGSRDLIDYLVQAARTYIYTTAMPPLLARLTRRSLELAQEESWRRERLRELVRRFRTAATGLGLSLMDSITPIQPILVGDSRQAMAMSERLRNAGILVTAIRPPTVPEGTARLRITFSADHTDAHLERLIAVLADVVAPEAQLS